MFPTTHLSYCHNTQAKVQQSARTPDIGEYLDLENVVVQGFLDEPWDFVSHFTALPKDIGDKKDRPAVQ